MHGKAEIINKLFAWLFLTTGIFAIIGSLFCWGEGWLFSQNNLSIVLIPLTDLLITGPLSLFSAYGLWLRQVKGIYASLLCSGIYIFGSVQVFITILWKGSPYPIQLIIPPIFGLIIAISFFIWMVKENPNITKV